MIISQMLNYSFKVSFDKRLGFNILDESKM